MFDFSKHLSLDSCTFKKDESIENNQKGNIYDAEICIYNNKLHLHFNEIVFSIQNENLVHYSIIKKDWEAIEKLIETNVYPALLFERGIVPFHASSFEFEKKGVLICAASEVGKSSIAFAFFKDGANFLNDDITPIYVDQTVYTKSSKNKTKLWQESLDYFNLSNENFAKVSDESEKYIVNLNQNVNKEKYPISFVFILSISNSKVHEYQILKASEKLVTLYDQLFRIRYLKAFNKYKQIVFKNMIEIGKSVQVIDIKRPVNATIEETKNFIKKLIQNEIV